MTATPTPEKTGLMSRLVRDALLAFYKRQGWTVFNEAQGVRRCVIVAAPHTSNWDFIYFLGGTRELGITPNFMGKDTLFRWPMRKFMLDMGGVPIDRSSSNNTVTQMANEFAKRDDLMLTIAVEGTRSAVGKLKTGFYHIAVQAGVPIVCGTLDYAKKRAGLFAPFWPTGDYEADLPKLLAVYKGVTPRNPDRTTIGK